MGKVMLPQGQMKLNLRFKQFDTIDTMSCKCACIRLLVKGLGWEVLQQIFGREVWHTIKKMDPIGSKVLSNLDLVLDLIGLGMGYFTKFSVGLFGTR